MGIWMREDGTITDEGDPTAFEYVPAVQRDQLREALERLLYEGSQTSESEFIANRVKARAALEAGGDA